MEKTLCDHQNGHRLCGCKGKFPLGREEVSPPCLFHGGKWPINCEGAGENFLSAERKFSPLRVCKRVGKAQTFVRALAKTSSRPRGSFPCLPCGLDGGFVWGMNFPHYLTTTHFERIVSMCDSIFSFVSLWNNSNQSLNTECAHTSIVGSELMQESSFTKLSFLSWHTRYMFLSHC